MKRYLWFVLLLFLLTACKKDKEDPAPKPPELPLATQTGANTFGCYVNGKPFIQQQRWAEPTVGTQLVESSSTGDYYIFIDAGNNNVDTLFPFSVFVSIIYELDVSKTYTTSDLKAKLWGGFLNFENPRTTLNTNPEVDEGWIKIDRFDLENKIISGRFEFTVSNPDHPEMGTYHITNGRFDCAIAF